MLNLSGKYAEVCRHCNFLHVSPEGVTDLV